MSTQPCRWGILSTANISRKNWKAIRLSGNGVVAGVSSRSAARADQFIDECQEEVSFPTRPRAFEGHQALLDSDEIDAVYVPLPTGIRKEWVIAAAQAKKHVLVEKPVANTAADAEEMREACRANGVQMMDGVMFDHSQRVGEMSAQIRDGKIGKVHRIQAHFSFAGDEAFRNENIRTDPDLEPHGCLGDLGWYCIRFILWMNDFADPVKVSGRIQTEITRPGKDRGVPGQFAGELIFASGVSAGFFCSFFTENQQLATVSGESGYLTVDDYVLPFYDSQTNWQTHQHVLEIDNCRWNFKRRTTHHACDEFHSGEANAAEVQMVKRFAELVASGSNDLSLADRAIQTQKVLDACLKSDAEDARFIPFS